MPVEIIRTPVFAPVEKVVAKCSVSESETITASVSNANGSLYPFCFDVRTARQSENVMLTVEEAKTFLQYSLDMIHEFEMMQRSGKVKREGEVI